MKNPLRTTTVTPSEKSALLIAATGIAFFCLLGFMASPAQAEALKPDKARFNSADGTPLVAWVYRSEQLVSKGSVVVLHGCSGLYAQVGSRKGQVNARAQAMAEMLVEQGYTVVFPDSMTPRGETEVCNEKVGDRRINQGHRRADALATMGWVATQPWAEADRIALLGWSYGGSAVLAATDAKNKDVARQAVTPAVAVAFFPGCNAALKSRFQPNTSLVMILAAKDDWIPPEACKQFGKTVGADVKVYAGTYHDFDNPTGGVTFRSEVPNEAAGGYGVHAGRDATARDQSYAYLRTVLRKAFSQTKLAGGHVVGVR